jgi:hypothetical protein
MGVVEIEREIARNQVYVDRYLKEGRDDEAESFAVEIQRLERKLVKEEAKLPTHPAYVFLPSLG